jgi:RNA polymerase sigma-70 factor (ECF subfamily)
MIEDVSDAARARFWAGLGTARRDHLDALPGWQERLRAALDEPSRTWNAAWLPREEFAAEVAARFDADDEEAARWWDHLRAADLYLACACARGVAVAIERFEQLYGPEIARTARRFERPGLAADDLVQLLRAKLFAAPDERPRIALYSGQGFLQNWVRVTTTRTFIDTCRREADAREAPMGAELIDVVPEPGADPELHLLKREHVAHFKAAFAEAVGALDSSDRVVLKHHMVDRLSIDQIGALYHLHRATAARRLARAREALLDGTRAALGRRLGLSPERLTDVLDLVASRLEVSVERLLR